ncbi:hypothetical protein N9Y42_03805 [Mariniblastus sp.]|nr:hypothetical protein [Mariniblastus sp.]
MLAQEMSSMPFWFGFLLMQYTEVSSMSSSAMESWFGLLFLAFLGLLLLGALALLIYWIVAKKRWLLMLMVMLPIVLVAVLVALSLVAVPRYVDVAKAGVTSTSGDNSFTDLAWSNALPPTADIYPSVELCARPLAFRIADAIRLERRGRDKFSVAFAKAKRPGDYDQWNPSGQFTSNFGKEFATQFPGSRVAYRGTKAGLQPLEIKLSFKPPENDANGEQTAGSISARWTKPDGTRALASIDFLNKPWVIEPADFIAKNYSKQLSVGFSKRLARSPAEASAMALTDASQNGPVTSSQVVDRFTQKLKLPYGELWQESILVDRNLASIADAKLHDIPRIASVSRAAEIVPSSTGQTEATSAVQRPKGLAPINGLILISLGLVAIGWISNLLTQGYYRQNIKYTVVTGVVVVLGLLVLLLLTVQV